MRDNNIISILDVLLTETTLVTKANPDSVRIWDHHNGTSKETTEGPGLRINNPVRIIMGPKRADKRKWMR